MICMRACIYDLVPVGAPSAIGWGDPSSKEITISWDPILAEEENGQLLGYKVIQATALTVLLPNCTCSYLARSAFVFFQF